jgi:hypothetical protein
MTLGKNGGKWPYKEKIKIGAVHYKFANKSPTKFIRLMCAELKRCNKIISSDIKLIRTLCKPCRILLSNAVRPSLNKSVNL